MGRSEQFVAAAALPSLLPTPPSSKMVPLLQTPCLIILPASFASPPKPKPGRADACDRWDSDKTASPSRNSSSRRRSPTRSSSSRASSDERWDIHKKPRLQAGALNGEKDRNAAMTMSLTIDKEISKPRHAVFAGPSFVAQEPCMLPFPKFLMAR